jgi:hypothetical protein
MHRNLIVLAAVIAVAACNSTPLPTISPNPSPSGLASPIVLPTPSGSPSPSPSPSPTASMITEHVGFLTVTHPVAWLVVPGPEQVPGRPVPLFYLSNAPLVVGPCPTPDPKTGDFQACPEPLAALSPGGVLVIVNPNLGVLAMNPPQVTVEAATGPCRAIGGGAEMVSVVGTTVLTACLRGPDLAAHEAEVRTVIASLKPAS